MLLYSLLPGVQYLDQLGATEELLENVYVLVQLLRLYSSLSSSNSKIVPGSVGEVPHQRYRHTS